MRASLPLKGLLFLLMVLLLPLPSQAERSQDFGDYVVHFNALNTNLLAPSVAGDYDIRRSPSQALINVAVLKKVMGTSSEPVMAKITGTATNLTGQQITLNMREIREGQAIYYIDTFRVSNDETLNFQLSVKPEGVKQAYSVVFRQQFFTQ